MILTSFARKIEDIANFVNMMVGPFTYNVKVKINFVSEQVPPDTPSNDDSDDEDDDWEYWFRSSLRGGSPRPKNRKHPGSDAGGLMESQSALRP